MEVKKEGWGGRRVGAGRKAKSAEECNPRPPKQIRAYPEEYALIKEFIKLVRANPEAARILIERSRKMKYVVYGTAVVAVEKEIEASSLEEAMRLANEDTVIDVSMDGQVLGSDCVIDMRFAEGSLAAE